MNSLSFSGFLVIVFSFIGAFVLSVMPLPAWAQLLNPQWLPMVLIFWILAVPYRVGLWTAWVVGILLDVLYGTLIGEHALALVIVAYLTFRFHSQIRMFPSLQQAFCVLLLVLVYQTLIIWIQGMSSQLSNLHWFWLSSVVSMFFWPVVNGVLRIFRRKFRIA